MRADAGSHTAHDAIVLSGVAKEFQISGGVVRALDGVTLTLADGEFVSVVGPSGCVQIEGHLVERPAANVGIVFQRATLLPWRSVVENINLQLEMRNLPRAA